MSVDVTVRVVRNGESERQGRVVSVLINELIKVIKRRQLVRSSVDVTVRVVRDGEQV